MSIAPQPRRATRPQAPPPAARTRPTRNLPPRKPFPITLVATAGAIAIIGILYFILRPRPPAEPPPPPPRLNLSWDLMPKRCQIIGAVWYDLLRSTPALVEVCEAGLQAWLPWLSKAAYQNAGLCLVGAILHDEEPAEYVLLMSLPKRLSEEEWQKNISSQQCETADGQKLYRIAKGGAEGYATLLNGTVAVAGTRKLVLEAASLAKLPSLGASLTRDTDRYSRAQEGMTQGIMWAEIRMSKKRIASLCDIFGVPPQKLTAESFEHFQALVKRKQNEIHFVGMLEFDTPDTAADAGRLIVGGLLGEWLGEEETPELIPAGKCLGIKCRLPSASLSALARRLRASNLP